jgi:SAM-dependent methyltransferase
MSKASMYSKIRTKNWLIKAILEDEVKRLISSYAKGVLLDVGCGVKPYKEFSSNYVQSYIGIDHADTPHGMHEVDVISSAYEISLDDSYADCILCTEVLEHLEEPLVALKEAHRLLRPGGIALYTIPFSWPVHEEPRDFYRYTEYGLRYLFEKAGFKILEIRALDGILVKLVQPLCYAMWNLRKGGMINPLWWLIPPLTYTLQLIAYRLNRIRSQYNSPNTDHYSVVATKS